MLVNAVRILLDLTTVFDTVDYNILSTHCVVICGMALNCFKSYLSCRWFSISIGSYSSKTTPLTSGAPQGSILGPLQLYTHLLGLFFQKTHHVPYHFFADETQIYLPLKPVSQPCDSKTEILVIPVANKQPVTFFTIPLDLETHFLNLRFKV